MLKKIESMEPEWLRKVEFPNWLVLLLAVVFILRIPSFFEPYHNAKELALLFSVNNIINLFWLKVIFTALVMASVVVFWKFTQKLAKKQVKIIIGATTSFAILVSIPLWGGNVFNMQTILVTFLIFAFWLMPSLSLVSKKNKHFTNTFVFASAWLLVSILYIALSPADIHNALIATPAIALLIGVLLASEKIDQSLTIVPFFVFIVFLVKINFPLAPTASYYTNFLNFTVQAKTQDDYLDYFHPQASLSYDIAKFLATSSTHEDKVFVWSESPAIYAITKKDPYIAPTSTQIKQQMSKRDVFGKIITDKPKFIVILPQEDRFPELHSYLQTGYILVEQINGANIWKYSESLSRLNQ